MPMTVRWTEGPGRAEIEIQGHRLTLKAGEWSDWVPLTFKVNALVARPRHDPVPRQPRRTGSCGSTPRP